ncbi:MULTISPECIES: GNAT family N-acetyltransferase [Streptomyces violaceusniger group]|uniref:GNAT family N-acetyltransferase n=2 Tax=Streptomyces violaceusniger group TaxID=2839105 RepID=A0ABD5J458_9ACTN|nr:GNAT family N-acetyltransferase [Streptomyces violaceusniger]KUL43744.1 acetyltransferase [Streptomyces violaceusniger]MEE4583130.1 GNAT family N-acetyltransferase [Streptomyces sp. DSM 41602]
MQILSFPEAATPTDLRVQVREIQEQAWPSERVSDVPVDAPSHDPALRPLSMLLVEEGTVLATLDILSKEIVHADRRFSAGGLSTVVTSKEARGRGYGRQLVTAAREEMITQSLDLGLFTCDRPLQAFYESAGWRVLPGAVLIGGTPQAPFPSDQPGFDKVTMADFFSSAGRQAQASFRHSRIELFPGEIDKLW